MFLLFVFASAQNRALHALTLKLRRARTRDVPVCYCKRAGFRAIYFFKGLTMNRTLLGSLMLATLALAACDRNPTVVNVPVPVAVPGPAGATGATGATGDTGKAGSGTTVIVTPPAPAASN